MTDPRYTDPWYSDPPPDTGLPQGDSIGGRLSLIVGIAAVVLIAVAVFAGIHHAINDGTHPASDKPLATTGLRRTAVSSRRAPLASADLHRRR